MGIRPMIVALTFAVVLPAGQSSAAGCPLVTDPRGDATPVMYGTATPADSGAGARSTDIVSADAWADATRLHVVVRVVELPAATATPNPHGYQWAVQLRAEGGVIDLHTLENNGGYEVRGNWVTVTGDGDTAAGAGVALKNATGSHDEATDQIWMSVPLSEIGQHTKVGKGVRWLPSAWTYLEVGTPGARAPGGYAAAGQGGLGNPADSAKGSRPMRLGSPECAGKPS